MQKHKRNWVDSNIKRRPNIFNVKVPDDNYLESSPNELYTSLDEDVDDYGVAQKSSSCSEWSNNFKWGNKDKWIPIATLNEAVNEEEETSSNECMIETKIQGGKTPNKSDITEQIEYERLLQRHIKNMSIKKKNKICQIITPSSRGNRYDVQERWNAGLRYNGENLRDIEHEWDTENGCDVEGDWDTENTCDVHGNWDTDNKCDVHGHCDTENTCDVHGHWDTENTCDIKHVCNTENKYDLEGNWDSDNTCDEEDDWDSENICETHRHNIHHNCDIKHVCNTENTWNSHKRDDKRGYQAECRRNPQKRYDSQNRSSVQSRRSSHDKSKRYKHGTRSKTKCWQNYATYRSEHALQIGKCEKEDTSKFVKQILEKLINTDSTTRTHSFGCVCRIPKIASRIGINEVMPCSGQTIPLVASTQSDSTIISKRHNHLQYLHIYEKIHPRELRETEITPERNSDCVKTATSSQARINLIKLSIGNETEFIGCKECLAKNNIEKQIRSTQTIHVNSEFYPVLHSKYSKLRKSYENKNNKSSKNEHKNHDLRKEMFSPDNDIYGNYRMNNELDSRDLIIKDLRRKIYELSRKNQHTKEIKKGKGTMGTMCNIYAVKENNTECPKNYTTLKDTLKKKKLYNDEPVEERELFSHDYDDDDEDEDECEEEDDDDDEEDDEDDDDDDDDEDGFRRNEFEFNTLSDAIRQYIEDNPDILDSMKICKPGCGCIDYKEDDDDDKDKDEDEDKDKDKKKTDDDQCNLPRFLVKLIKGQYEPGNFKLPYNRYRIRTQLKGLFSDGLKLEMRGK